jgi:ferritin-like protein
MAHEGYHEPIERLSPATQDFHRAVISLIEELEAIDWYNQRIDATDDAELARVLTHSRDEEKEHAMMTLEWLRRHDVKLDEQARKYLFTASPLPLPEEPAGGAEATEATTATAAGGGTLGIGSLRDDTTSWGGI